MDRNREEEEKDAQSHGLRKKSRVIGEREERRTNCLATVWIEEERMKCTDQLPLSIP